MRALMVSLTLLMAGLAGPVRAHPHVFIDTGLEFLADADGNIAAIRVVWVYDELYSLLLIEDLGLDADGDNTLTAEETARLNGFDMAWDEGFAGDVYGFADEQPIGLSRPVEFTASYREGRVISTHVRTLATPVDPRSAEIAFRLYDPSYYTAYAASLTSTVMAELGCEAVPVPFDPETAYAELEARVREAEAAGIDTEMDFPEVGEAFADEVRLQCEP